MLQCNNYKYNELDFSWPMASLISLMDGQTDADTNANANADADAGGWTHTHTFHKYICVR